MWTKAQRERHERLVENYPSSLTDAEWAELMRADREPHPLDVAPSLPGGLDARD